MHHATTLTRPGAGFTVVELLCAVAVATLLATIVWPTYAHRLAQVRRADAVDALDRVHGAQESYRAHHGLYAPSLDGLLGAAPRSAKGLYDVRIEHADDGAYRAVATARADGAQAQDRECAQITLSVQLGLPEYGPHLRCWNR